MSQNTAVGAAGETTFNSEDLARELVELTWDLKGLNTVVLDLRGHVSYTDYLVITSGTSERQVQAIGRHVERSLRDLGYRPLSVEGLESGRWALLDYGDALLNVFNMNARGEYDLEGMWADAPRLELEDMPSSLYGHFDMAQFED